VGEHASQAPRAPRAPQADDRTAQEAELAGDAYYRDEAADAEQRARVMRGRRRMLWLLLVLTVAAIGLTYLKLASWWIMVPPVVLLGGYLLLLREAAQADAEARERRELADSAVPAASPATAPATEAAPAAAAARGAIHETGPRAEIIDLSEHVGDQLYDQYADAKLRAVGD
jgi:septal ring-binding cell division protein DamX